MALLGQAVLAMWWTVPSEHRDEFEDWHGHEHFPERLGIPGFLRGARWAARDGKGGQFVMYELTAVETLTSAPYLERLNAPSLWSQRMMPHHLGMVRCQCRVLESFGGGVAGSLATVRLSPENGAADRLRSALRVVMRDVPLRTGLTGAHLLEAQTPNIPLTVEQKIRGADKTADWIILVSGYDAAAVDACVSDALSDTALIAAGAMRDIVRTTHRLAYVLTAQDVAHGVDRKEMPQ
ncbi:MAG: hypothetical protein ABL898_17440 [Hyphomicrobiaceae bacterium]